VLRVLVVEPLVLRVVQQVVFLLHHRFVLWLLLLEVLLCCEGLNDLGIALPLT
jgi:hypothetical protein